jgi:hypothetical protein
MVLSSLINQEKVFPSAKKRSVWENVTLFAAALLYLPLAIILHSNRPIKDLEDTAKRAKAA